MRFSTITLGALVLAATATPAFAQDDTAPAPDFKLTSGITLVSEYRFRGTTQTDSDPAIQGTFNVNHSSGLYAGLWASTIDGGPNGRTPALAGYGKEEVDLYGGYTKTYDNGLGVDFGLLYYFYADRAKGLNTDFFEPYASVSYTIGPVSTKFGGNYAWGGQKGLSGFDAHGGNDDNMYVYGEAALAIPTTPVTLKGHYGYSIGALGSLNAPGTNDNDYTDWSVTAEAVGGPFKVGVSYVDTDISNAGGFAKRLGRGSTVLGYIGVSF